VTVNNIDWPSGRTADPAVQKADFIRILDLHQKNGMNAMIVQVRPAGDAFYPSPYEPWSQWLTGIQGKAPSPYWDPLQFMIEETHKRGMEFHAWLNPYRAIQTIGTSSISPNHIMYKHPEWFLVYGDKKYFNPGNKEAQAFVVNVVRDIVKRYDVDAIHMDDYFYPYRIPGKEFPDEATYRNSGTTLNKNDWRRSNTNSIIEELSKAIKEEKKLCQFGISPFGVWRNKKDDPEGSDSKAGTTNYDDLYADILLWLKKGWIDYVTPQLYREIGDGLIDYEKLVDWWGRHSYGKHIYIGHAIYRGVTKETKAWSNPKEIPEQIKILRSNPNVQGSIYFSSNSFNKNPHGWNDSLRDNYYRYPALLPPMNWIDNQKPLHPDVEKDIKDDSSIQLKIKPDDSQKHSVIKYFVVYKYATDIPGESRGNIAKNISRIITNTDGFKFSEHLPSEHRSYHYSVTAVGKNNIESDPIEITVLQQPGGKWIFY
ncbi:MAG: family 10 glycosylhydrolase, partial [Bacteroidota bacterium]